jgi:hypothetical protein
MFRTGAISVRISGKGKKAEKVEIKPIPCRIRNRFRDSMRTRKNSPPAQQQKIGRNTNAKKKEHLFTVKLIFKVVPSLDKRYPTNMKKVLKALHCGCDVEIFQAFAQQLTVPISNLMNSAGVYYSVVAPVHFEAGEADREGCSFNIFRVDVENNKLIDE